MTGDPPNTVCFASTEHERKSLKQPITDVLEYARDTLGATVEFINPTANSVSHGERTIEQGRDPPALVDGEQLLSWSCADSPQRIERMTKEIELGGYDSLVVDSLASVGDNTAEIYDRVGRVVGSGSCDLHIVNQHLVIDSECIDAVLSVLGMLDTAGIEMQRRSMIQDIRSESADLPSGGRAPTGFEWRNGELVPADDYDEVCAMLEMLKRDEVSKRKAADQLDVSMRAVGRALDHPARYRLG